MRLIDADAFDKMLIEAQTECKKNGGNFRFGVLGNVRANLALFPTVDRPEIVRCKDCKNAVLTTSGEAKYCKFWQGDEDGTYGGDPLYLDGEFYCAAGERAENARLSSSEIPNS